MAGLFFPCPECRRKMKVRSSQSLSEVTKKAFLYCEHCDIKATLLAELSDLRQGVYKPYTIKQAKQKSG